MALSSLNLFANPIQEIEDCYGDASCVGKVLVKVIRNNSRRNPIPVEPQIEYIYSCTATWNGWRTSSVTGKAPTYDNAIKNIESQCKSLSFNDVNRCIEASKAATCKKTEL